MQNRVFVLDAQRAPLMPCHPARARELLREGKAAVFRRFPFTIILNERNGGGTQNLTIKSDPGSKTTGLALVAAFRRGLTVIWAGELAHRGHIIHAALERRSDQRHSRRSRKTRHRAPRFDHRTRPAGGLVAAFHPASGGDGRHLAQTSYALGTHYGCQHGAGALRYAGHAKP